VARCEECRAHCLPAQVELCAACAVRYYALVDAAERVQALLTRWSAEDRMAGVIDHRRIELQDVLREQKVGAQL